MVLSLHLLASTSKFSSWRVAVIISPTRPQMRPEGERVSTDYGLWFFPLELLLDNVVYFWETDRNKTTWFLGGKGVLADNFTQEDDVMACWKTDLALALHCGRASEREPWATVRWEQESETTVMFWTTHLSVYRQNTMRWEERSSYKKKQKKTNMNRQGN